MGKVLPIASQKPTEAAPALRKGLLTAQDAADYLSIDRSTLYVLLMRGEIPSLKIGRARRVSLAALDRWIAEQESTAYVA